MPTAQDKSSSAPLHCASEGDHLEVALVLLEHDTDASAQDKDEWIHLHLASRGGHVIRSVMARMDSEVPRTRTT